MELGFVVWKDTVFLAPSFGGGCLPVGRQGRDLKASGLGFRKDTILLFPKNPVANMAVSRPGMAARFFRKDT